MALIGSQILNLSPVIQKQIPTYRSLYDYDENGSKDGSIAYGAMLRCCFCSLRFGDSLFYPAFLRFH